MFHTRGTLCWLFCALLSLGGISISTHDSKAEVIYENLTTPQSAFVSETREHGDQIDLGGTARRLTQIVFYYYANFVPTGDEVVKVRLYNNLTPYDNYRKSPTTLLYESDWISIDPGTTITRTFGLTLRPFSTDAAARRSDIRELVQLPMNTTFTACPAIGLPGCRSI